MSKNEFTIRAAVEADADALYGLMTDLGYQQLSLAEFGDTFAAVLRHPEMILLVAEAASGRVVGLASISHRPQLRLAGTLATIDELVVADVMRGCGVGKALLEEAKRAASRLNARRLELETNRARDSYRRQFYIKNGFFEADSAVMRIDPELPT